MTDIDRTSEKNDDIHTPILKLDPALFMDDLEGFDMSEDQKHELLQALWNIMRTMVDIGWGVDNVQYLMPHIFEKAGRDSVKLLEIEDHE